ncbi:MAG: Membrane-bound hydrogenase MBH 2, subunit Mbh2M (Hydrogenase subunit), partial [Thermococcus sp. 40_45]
MTPETIFYAVGMPIIGVFLGLVYKGIDRRVSARMTSRIGPPIRQPFWDVGKLLLKETIVPANAVKWIFNAMPILALASSMTLLLYIPFGIIKAPLEGYGDLVVILYLLTLQALAMAIGGFASGSPFSSVGAQREMVLMMSYEMPFAIV